jgi:hypothetical protein
MKRKPHAGSVANRSGDTAHHFSFPHREELSLHPAFSRRTSSVCNSCRKLGARSRLPACSRKIPALSHIVPAVSPEIPERSSVVPVVPPKFCIVPQKSQPFPPSCSPFPGNPTAFPRIPALFPRNAGGSRRLPRRFSSISYVISAFRGRQYRQNQTNTN